MPEGADGRVLAGIQANTDAQVIRAVATLAGLIMLSLAAGWLIAGRFLRPLRTITATARDISASNLNRRLALTGRNDEFKDLGDTLDGLFGRLEASFEAQRHFVANASHELRTPLAAERTLLQVALADPEATADTLRETCQQVLALGRPAGTSHRGAAHPGQQRARRRAVGTLRPGRHSGPGHRRTAARKPNAGASSSSAALTAAPATGDPSLAESLVANLVDNAIRHNIPGGQVEVSTTMTDGRAVIRVTNTGTVIPPAEVDRLFQPFQQLGHERIRHGDRLRARPGHRPCHRHRPQGHAHRRRPARGRPRHRGELPLTRHDDLPAGRWEPGRAHRRRFP